MLASSHHWLDTGRLMDPNQKFTATSQPYLLGIRVDSNEDQPDKSGH